MINHKCSIVGKNVVTYLFAQYSSKTIYVTALLLLPQLSSPSQQKLAGFQILSKENVCRLNIICGKRIHKMLIFFKDFFFFLKVYHPNLKKKKLFIWLRWVLVWHVRSSVFVAACKNFQLWHVGSSSLTRDQTWTPCIGTAESQLLDHQESP